jgi:hypothetical protein
MVIYSTLGARFRRPIAEDRFVLKSLAHFDVKGRCRGARGDIKNL